ncbi:FkbM family methyltransferase [Fertoebacter nigrum]|uniref:FkbM family methyltransferase n=1 Tax=Fertoeibacter niger TaxID=2656921 RepID=A0A8X8GW32_9RHOB|nr:FkbM family methyltransferase [Fertoeibacter niger]
MAEYLISGVTLHIPDALMTGQLDTAMASGKYEHTEAEALLKHLRPRDRFLDLGAGAGFLASLAGKVVAAPVAGVEAGPQMAPVAQANLARNGVTGEIAHGAVVPDAFDGDHVVFTVRRSFWASSLTPREGAKNAREVAVPALRFGTLLERFRPTVLSIDIEGGELDLLNTPLPPDLRLMVMEIHPAIYGKAGIKRIFDAASAQGFTYAPMGSRAATVVLERVA